MDEYREQLRRTPRPWDDLLRGESRLPGARANLERTPECARGALRLLDDITHGVATSPDRSDPGFRVLRQTLGYGWSVAIAALPAEGFRLFDRWAESNDGDVAWIVAENRKKDRLKRLSGA